jgi:type I thyroxine 5'-deiodinase
LYLIDRDGKVAFKSPPGPFGFKPDDLKAALVKVVGK